MSDELGFFEIRNLEFRGIRNGRLKVVHLEGGVTEHGLTDNTNF